MKDMECIDCGVDLSVRPLYRTTPLGTIPANWKCEKCLTEEQGERIPEDVKDITNIIFKDGKGG